MDPDKGSGGWETEGWAAGALVRVERTSGRSWRAGLQRGSGEMLGMRAREREGKRDRRGVRQACQSNHTGQTLRGTSKDGNRFCWDFGCCVCPQE